VAPPVLHDLKALLDKLKPLRPAGTEITCKHFLSDAAAHLGGKIFMSLLPLGLALKLPEDVRVKLMAEGGTLLRYFPNASVQKDHLVLPDELAEDTEALIGLSVRALSMYS
jgi:hypothetical protein